MSELSTLPATLPATLPTNCPHFINETGNIHEKWNVLSYAGSGKWLCRCECGKEAVVRGMNLRNHSSKQCDSCGQIACSRAAAASGASARNQVKATQAAVSSGASARNLAKATQASIASGAVARNLAKGSQAAVIVNIIHGHSHSRNGKRSPTYSSWYAMKNRCYNPRYKRYPSYGGAGVIVCDRWRYSFENFLADLGERSEGTTLGRYGDIGNYEPGNCKWMTREEQLAERRAKRQNK